MLSLSNIAILADGGAGNDNLTGNTGADTFVVGFDGIDTITDFNFSEGDTIQLSSAELGISSLESLSHNTNDNTLYLGETGLATLENVELGFNPTIFIYQVCII